MESKVKLLGHAIHPMLIVFPLGLLATSLIFDIIYLITDNGTWSQVAFYDIAAGIIGGLAAAGFRVVDWVGVTPGHPRQSIRGGGGGGDAGGGGLLARRW